MYDGDEASSVHPYPRSDLHDAPRIARRDDVRLRAPQGVDLVATDPAAELGVGETVDPRTPATLGGAIRFDHLDARQRLEEPAGRVGHALRVLEVAGRIVYDAEPAGFRSLPGPARPADLRAGAILRGPGSSSRRLLRRCGAELHEELGDVLHIRGERLGPLRVGGIVLEEVPVRHHDEERHQSRARFPHPKPQDEQAPGQELHHRSPGAQGPEEPLRDPALPEAFDEHPPGVLERSEPEDLPPSGHEELESHHSPKEEERQSPLGSGAVGRRVVIGHRCVIAFPGLTVGTRPSRLTARRPDAVPNPRVRPWDPPFAQC